MKKVGNLALFLLLLIIITSCNDSKQFEVIKYYDGTTNIKSKKLFSTNRDVEKGNYFIENYSENGNLSEISEFHDDNLNGLSRKFSDSGNVIFKCVFKNNIENGISKWYNEEQFLTSERLIIDGKEYLYKQFVRNIFWDTLSGEILDTIYGYRIYRNIDGTYKLESDIKLDNLLEPIDSLSFYFKTNIPDTVKVSDTLYFTIELVLNDSETYGKLVLYMGELTNNFSLRDTVSFFSAERESRTIKAKYFTNQMGYQIVTGLIDVEVLDLNNSLKERYASLTFYHQIYVE